MLLPHSTAALASYLAARVQDQQDKQVALITFDYIRLHVITIDYI